MDHRYKTRLNLHPTLQVRGDSNSIKLIWQKQSVIWSKKQNYRMLIHKSWAGEPHFGRQEKESWILFE